VISVVWVRFVKAHAFNVWKQGQHASDGAQTEHGESFVVRPPLLVRGPPLHRNVPSRSQLIAPNKPPKEHLPSLFADGCVRQEFGTVLPEVRSASHTNDGMAVVETLARAADASQACPKSKPGVAHIRARGELGKGTLVFSTRFARASSWTR